MGSHGPLTRYEKLRVAHSPGMPGTFSRNRLIRKPLVSDRGMHHGTCVTHAMWCMSVSLTRGSGESFPAFPARAQPAILRIWQKVHVVCHIYLTCACLPQKRVPTTFALSVKKTISNAYIFIHLFQHNLAYKRLQYIFTIYISLK